MTDKKTGWAHEYFNSWNGTKLFYRFYPVSNARHTMIMLHGYGEHSGRYEKFPPSMRGVAAQFAIMDFRGMGKSESVRGDTGFFGDSLKDVTSFIEHLRRKHSIPKKIILFGHSLGGLIATCWAMENPDFVKRLILSAPFLGFRFSRLIALINGFLLIFAPRFIYRNPVPSHTLTHDPVEIAIHRKDPLILRSISAQLVGEILRRMEILKKQPIVSVPFPVHLLESGEEGVVDSKASRRFFDRLVCPRKERTFFDGFYHELFNEKEQQKAFNVLKTIIEDCV